VTTSAEALKVVIVEDHAVVREGLCALLGTRSDVDVVGVAADGIEALHVVRETQPDVVLMDLGMPRMDGVEATRRIVAETPAPAVLVLTMSDSDTALLSAVRAGARGYLLKHSEGHHVVSALHGVAAGQAVFGPGVAPAVLMLLHAPPAQQPPPFPQITDREREVLGHIGDGLGNQAIAARLGVSPKTVANVVSTILVKLDLTDRAAAAARARAAGLEARTLGTRKAGQPPRRPGRTSVGHGAAPDPPSSRPRPPGPNEETTHDPP